MGLTYVETLRLLVAVPTKNEMCACKESHTSGGKKLFIFKKVTIGGPTKHINSKTKSSL